MKTFAIWHTALAVLLMSALSHIWADDESPVVGTPSGSAPDNKVATFPSPLPPKESLTYRSILEWSHENGMPGAILLVKSPKTNFLESIGLADVKQSIPMRTDHAFRIGSVTKTFLGVVAAQLQTEGKLDTDLPITNYLPASITDHIANSNQITVRQLVRHQSGIFNYTENPLCLMGRMLLDRRGAWPPLRFLEYAYDKPANFDPGKGWSYSNSNFLLLGLIIDHASGHHHSAEIRSHILDPLKLSHTYYELSEPERGERAHGYETVLGKSEDTFDWTPDTTGAAGLVSTVSDLAVFVRAATGTESFLNEPTRKLLKSHVRPGNDDDPSFPVLGYDFGITAHRGARKDIPSSVAPWFFGHDGATPGYFCMAFHEPKNDITIVYFGSSQLICDPQNSQLNAFENRLEEALFGLAMEQIRNKSDNVSPVKHPE